MSGKMVKQYRRVVRKEAKAIQDETFKTVVAMFKSWGFRRRLSFCWRLMTGTLK